MVPAPRRLKAFPGAERAKPKSGRHRWIDTENGYIYEWIINMPGLNGMTGEVVISASLSLKPAS